MSAPAETNVTQLRAKRDYLHNEQGAFRHNAAEKRLLDQRIADEAWAAENPDKTGSWRIAMRCADGHLEPLNVTPRFESGPEAQAWLDEYSFLEPDYRTLCAVIHLPTRQELAKLSFPASCLDSALAHFARPAMPELTAPREP